MLRILGMLGIAAGSLMGLWEWRGRCVRRVRRLEEMTFFLRRAQQALGREQQPIIDFFELYPGREELLRRCLGAVAEALRKNRYASGEEAWREVFSDTVGEWELTRQQRECLLECGRAFFGNSRRELVELLEIYRGRMEEFREGEKRRLAERQRVVFPVGMLGSVMLILLLL